MRCGGLGHHGVCRGQGGAMCPCYPRMQAAPDDAKAAGEGAVGAGPRACDQVPSRPVWTVLGEGTRPNHLLSVPNFFHPQAACSSSCPALPGELLGPTLGVPSPPQEPGPEPALTMRPLGTPRCLGFPGMPLLFTGPRLGGDPPWGLWAAPQAELAGRQAGGGESPAPLLWALTS